jgi:hypothetical protein
VGVHIVSACRQAKRAWSILRAGGEAQRNSRSQGGGAHLIAPMHPCAPPCCQASMHGTRQRDTLMRICTYAHTGPAFRP